MKRILCLLVILTMFAFPAYGADVKVSALTATTTIADNDLLMISYYNAGNYYSRKITFGNVKTVLQPYNAKLLAIAALGNTAGYLKNDGAGVFSYATPTGGTGSGCDTVLCGFSTAEWIAALSLEVGVDVQGFDAATLKTSETITANQLFCASADGLTAVSCGAKVVDNSTANHILAKDNAGEVENLTTDTHLSLTGTTAPALAVVTPEVDGSAHVHLTAAQMTGTGVIVTNFGQSGEVDILLPAAAAGLSGLFVVGDAEAAHWGVTSNTGDDIYLVAAAGTVSQCGDQTSVIMTAAQVGQSFACWTFKTGASAYDWACKAIAIGTSTFACHAAISAP